MRKYLSKVVILDALMVALIVSLTLTSLGTASPSPVIFVDPPISSAAPGDWHHVDVNISDIVATESLYSWEFDMSFDPNILNLLAETNTTNNEVVNGTVRVKQPPLASFTISPDPPYVKRQDLTFNASTSTPEGGELIDPDSYYWNFSDLVTTYGMVVTHKYTSAGNYTVTLRVTDTEGLTGTTSQNITVYDRLPIALSPTKLLVEETAPSEANTSDNVLEDNVATVSEVSASSFVNTRDIIVTNVVSYPSVVVGNETVYINITVRNNPLGYKRESFIVYAYAGAIRVGETTGSLSPGESKIYSFTWTTTSYTPAGNYTIEGTVPPLAAVEEGPFLKKAGTTRLVGYKPDNLKGTLVASWALFPYPAQGATGNGTLATVIFEVIAEGKTALHFYKTQLWTYRAGWPYSISHTKVDGIFTILGDMDGNGGVDSDDLYVLARAYGTKVEDPGYKSLADLDRDDDVDSNDLYLFALKYGTYVGP